MVAGYIKYQLNALLTTSLNRIYTSWRSGFFVSYDCNLTIKSPTGERKKVYDRFKKRTGSTECDEINNSYDAYF